MKLPVALLWLGFATGLLLSGSADATGLARKHALPADQASDVFGVEPGMTLPEVRKLLAAQFPAAFAGCGHQLESSLRLVCRLSARAYYQELAGRPLSRTAQPPGAEYVSNLVLTAEEGGIKRSMEVFFGSGVSGREAYRITGTTHYGGTEREGFRTSGTSDYAANIYPEIALYRNEFIRKFGPLRPVRLRGPSSVEFAAFSKGMRLMDAETDDVTLDCIDMAKAATSAHDMRALSNHVVVRYLKQPPCDVMISLAIAPAPAPDLLSAVTIIVFDAARMAKIYQLETEHVAAEPRLPRPPRQ